MRHLFDKLDSIAKKIFAAKTCLLMLDFDGTLSPIASSPGKARINRQALKALKNLSGRKNIMVAIMSGRSLADLKNKIGIKGLVYAGNHGLEWQIGKKKFLAQIPKAHKKIMSAVQSKLLALLKQYRGTFLENKGITLAVHYRQLNKKLRLNFKNKVVLLLQPYINSNALSALKGKKVIDIKPFTKWNKGSFVFYLANLFKKKKARPLLIYIGDDETDEDAFKVLKKGITARVGKKNNSAARYFVNNPSQVAAFLVKLSNEMSRN